MDILNLQYLKSHQISESWIGSKIHIHSLHKICSRICSLPPVMPRYFIAKYSEVGDTVLDSFSGKGTVPLEACLMGRIGIGNDASPEAFILTYSKIKPVSIKKIENFLDHLRLSINRMDSINGFHEIDKKAQIFYSKETFRQILKIRNILKENDNDVAIFVKALMCGILHGSSKLSLSLPSSHSFSMSPKYVENYAKKHKLRRPHRDVIQCLYLKASEVLKDDLPKIKGNAYNLDARNMPVLKSNSIDLVITSPPYFNLGTYAWNNWLRLWFLGYDYKKIRKSLVETNSKNIYGKFMRDSLVELMRVLKKDSYCFIIVGDVKLNGSFLNTAAFLAKIADDVGFEIESIINDNIPKGRKHYNYLKENQGIKKDRILCLKKN